MTPNLDQRSAPGYRADLDGMRGIAVLLVVLFHLDLAILTGGFVGVDVFFTLSGFFITRLINKDIRAEVFSIRRFYVRRVRRLFCLLYTSPSPRDRG